MDDAYDVLMRRLRSTYLDTGSLPESIELPPGEYWDLCQAAHYKAVYVCEVSQDGSGKPVYVMQLSTPAGSVKVRPMRAK